jgi:alpha-glucosidase
MSRKSGRGGAIKSLRFVKSYGLAGIWCDMNEPASFKGPLPDDVLFGKTKHEEIHDLYGHYMAKATYDGLRKATAKRPFVITRACYSGTEKYSTVWTGDNQSIWSNLRMLIAQEISLGLCGDAFRRERRRRLRRGLPVRADEPLDRNGDLLALAPEPLGLRLEFQEPYRYDKKTEEQLPQVGLFPLPA